MRIFVNLYFLMVNESLSTKNKVLDILRNSSEYVSGELLSQETGVSRVSVWKAVQVLQNAGYGIVSDRNGYFLQQDLKDSLFPWEFGISEGAFTHFVETESTMHEARKIILSEEKKDLPKITVVTADRQTNGHGHGDHGWTTTKGSLACTLADKVSVSSAEAFRISMCAQIAAVNVLKKTGGRNFYARWPNDVWSDSGKVCGILDEYLSSGQRCEWVNIGIGINMYARPKIQNTDKVFDSENAASRKDLLSSLCAEFLRVEKTALEDSCALENLWNSLWCDVGKKIILEQSGETFTFCGVNAYGWAVLESVDGKTKKIIPPGVNVFKK